MTTLKGNYGNTFIILLILFGYYSFAVSSSKVLLQISELKDA